ncbi:hypothetical protein R50912_07505 [Paenibacillus sp. FSL R5-0912]|nr:hypothetical protein R50912_07505 [Paenibacillus sp. FSL R5-0912]
MEDLISIGTIGLIKAIESYRPNKGTKLATFAARCIENEILITIVVLLILDSFMKSHQSMWLFLMKQDQCKLGDVSGGKYTFTFFL